MNFGNENNIYLRQKHSNLGVWTFAFFFFVISFFLVFSKNLSAMDSSKEEEEKLYKQGLAYRDKKEWSEAIKCFQPLAEKKNPKAEHNLAFCFLSSGDEIKAYQWYQRANKQGFSPSTRNLGRMNLLYLLLPDDSLNYIASFLTLSDLFCISTISCRARGVVRSVLTSTNFVSSTNPYALDFLSLLNNMRFDAKLKELRVLLSARVDKGSIEVHFRDSEHLRNIVKKTPLIEVEDRLYFVHDNNAEDNKELVPTEGGLQEAYFIRFVADTPLKVSGIIEHFFRCRIYLPRGSDFNALALKAKAIICEGVQGLESYNQAYALAVALETFNDQLLNIRTAEAYRLLEDRQNSRLQSPNLYPGFFDLCPDVCLISSPNLEISQKEYISAKQPFIYISKSIADMTELQNRLPEFCESISYINPGCHQLGVYCEGPLILGQAFNIFSETDLTLAGKIELYDHALKLTSNSSIWIMGPTVKTDGPITVKGRFLHRYGCYTKREDNVKPDGMLEEDWQKLLIFWHRSGRIQ